MRITLLSLLIMACAAPNMLADPSLSIRRGYLMAIPMQHPMVTDLGGPKGTRKSYSNEVLYVTGWKYINGI